MENNRNNLSSTTSAGHRIDRFPEFDGADAEPSGVMATRHELHDVARYWYRQFLHDSFLVDQGWFACSGYSARLAIYCVERLSVIQEVLGSELMRGRGTLGPGFQESRRANSPPARARRPPARAAAR